MSALPSSKKTHSERNKQILRQLLKEAENKTCADCKSATHPRWASWNLGCFVCIRCSGIHRSMGTHISRVKSVDLDAWTDEQIESMLLWGNSKCNSYWEAKLPDGYIPDSSKIENFIRTKYDLKKWIASGDPSAHKNSKPQPAKPPVAAAASSKSTAPSKSQPSSLLLDDDFGDFSSALPTPSHTPSLVSSPKLTQPVVPQKSAASDLALLYQRPEPAPSASASASAKLTSQSLGLSAQNSGASGHGQGGRTDLKKSILSLYSSPSSSTSSFSAAQPSQQSFQTRQSVSSMTSSMQNINLNSTRPLTGASTKPAHVQSAPLSTNSTSSLHSVQTSGTGSSLSGQNPQPSWNNQWSDTPNQWKAEPVIPTKPIASTTSTMSLTLDDDLFKNVWS